MNETETEILKLRIENQLLEEERNALLEMVHWLNSQLNHNLAAFGKMGQLYSKIREGQHKHGPVEAKP